MGEKFKRFVRYYYSDSSECETADDDRDKNYSPNSDDDSDEFSCIDNPVIDSEASNSFNANEIGQDQSENEPNPHNENEAEQQIVFGADLSLRPVEKTKSNADFELWKLFGTLMKNGAKVGSMADRILCSLCFENKELKRFALIQICAINMCIQYRNRVKFYTVFISFASLFGLFLFNSKKINYCNAMLRTHLLNWLEFAVPYGVMLLLKNITWWHLC